MGFFEKNITAPRAETWTIGLLALLTFILPIAGVTSVRDPLILGAALCWLIRMKLTGDRRLFRTPLDWPLGLLILTGLISIITSIDPWYTASEIRGEMLKGVLLFYLAVNAVRTVDRAAVLLFALLAGIAVMDVYGVVHFFLRGGSLVYRGMYAEPSLHQGIQEFGTYLVQTGPYLACTLLGLKSRRARTALLALASLHVLSVYITFNRMALLGLVVQAFLFVWFMGANWKTVAGGLAAMILVVGLALPRPIFLTGDKADTGDYKIFGVGIDGFKGDRVEIWKPGLKYLTEHPFTPVGYGRRNYVKKFPEVQRMNPAHWHAHNTFLNLAVQLGLQGLFAFLLVLVQIFRGLWPGRGRLKTWRQARPVQLALLAAWIMTAGFLVRNLMDDLFNNDAALLFWLMIGVSFSLKIFSESPPDQAGSAA